MYQFLRTLFFGVVITTCMFSFYHEFAWYSDPEKAGWIALFKFILVVTGAIGMVAFFISLVSDRPSQDSLHKTKIGFDCKKDIAVKAFARCLEEFFMDFFFDSFEAITALSVEDDSFFCEIRRGEELIAYGVVNFIGDCRVVVHATASCAAVKGVYGESYLDAYWAKEKA